MTDMAMAISRLESDLALVEKVRRNWRQDVILSQCYRQECKERTRSRYQEIHASSPKQASVAAYND